MPTALQYFASLVAEDESFALLEAAIAVAQDEYPELDPQGVLAQVDALADRLKRRVPADAVPVQRLRLLNRYFFAGPRLRRQRQRLLRPAQQLPATRCWRCAAASRSRWR